LLTAEQWMAGENGGRLVIFEVLQKWCEKIKDLLLGEVELVSGGGDLAEEGEDGLTALVEWDFGGGGREDAEALAGGEFDKVIALEDGVGFGDGHGVDLEGLGECADGG